MIAPTGMSWAEAIEVVVTPADGTVTQWDFKLDGRSESPELTLPHRSHIVVGWMLAPEQTAVLGNGRYRLAAKLSLSGTAGWNGTIESNSVTVTIVDEPLSLDEELATRKATLTAQYEIAERRLENAAAVIDDLLARYPKSSQGLFFRSRILELEGRVPEAWMAAQQAVQAFDEVNPNVREPPFALLNHERALFTRLQSFVPTQPAPNGGAGAAPLQGPTTTSSTTTAPPQPVGAAYAGGVAQPGASAAQAGGSAAPAGSSGGSQASPVAGASADAGAAAASSPAAATSPASGGAGAAPAGTPGVGPSGAGAVASSSPASGAAGVAAADPAAGGGASAHPAAGAEAAVSVAPAGAAPAGSTVVISWAGPNSRGDYVTVVRRGALPHEYLSYAYTSRGNPVSITLPAEPGPYEIRYVRESPRSVLATVAYEATAVSATLTAPQRGIAGSTVSVTWTGPNYARDWISIALPDAADIVYADYFYANGGDGMLDLPVEPGTYEFRYVQDGPKVLARARIDVAAATAEITAPVSVGAGQPFEVSWSGPNNRGDWVTIVAPTAGALAYGSYAETESGGPKTLRAPAEAGRYEVRYVLKGRKVVATRAIDVLP